MTVRKFDVITLTEAQIPGMLQKLNEGGWIPVKPMTYGAGSGSGSSTSSGTGGAAASGKTPTLSEIREKKGTLGSVIEYFTPGYNRLAETQANIEKIKEAVPSDLAPGLVQDLLEMQGPLGGFDIDALQSRYKDINVVNMNGGSTNLGTAIKNIAENPDKYQIFRERSGSGKSKSPQNIIVDMEDPKQIQAAFENGWISKDVAEANYLAVTAPWDKWNQVYNVGTGEEITAEEAGKAICEITRWPGEIEIKEGRTVDPERFVYDMTKSKVMLGFEPKFTFKQGLEDMFYENK
jgi:hypothetical protein